MKETEIRKYAALMKELDLTGLEVTDENGKVRMERMGADTASAPVNPVSREAAASAPVASEEFISVRSPIVGVFYAAPAENADAYVAIGDRVKKGQVLCIVEAMKLMNEIASEEDGVIAEICVTNGQVVEYGTELFRMKRQEDE